MLNQTSMLIQLHKLYNNTKLLTIFITISKHRTPQLFQTVQHKQKKL